MAIVPVSVLVVLLYNPGSSSRRRRQTAPDVDLDATILANATQESVQQASRSAVAWLSVAVTAHSLVIVGLARYDPPGSEPIQEVIQGSLVVGMAAVILSTISLPAASAIFGSDASMHRFLSLARRHAALGPAYRFAFPEAQRSWARDLHATALATIGMLELSGGIMLLAMATLFSAV